MSKKKNFDFRHFLTGVSQLLHSLRVFLEPFLAPPPAQSSGSRSCASSAPPSTRDSRSCSPSNKCTGFKASPASSRVGLASPPGNGLNVVRIVPFSAYEFFFFDVYRRQLPGDSFHLKFLSGALTGMTASTLVGRLLTQTYPLDLLRTIKSIRVQENPSILTIMREIMRNSGLTGFYRGWMASLLGVTPYIAIKMSTFDYLRTRYLPTRDVRFFHTINLTIGGLAGCCALTITYPTDLIRRHLQMQSVGK